MTLYYIGVDLGGTSIKVGLVSKEGEIIKKMEADTPVQEGFEGVVEKIHELINIIIKEVGIEEKKVEAIGIGVPGVSNEEGLVYFAPNLFWENVPLGERLEKLSDIKVYVENDATVAAVGEYTRGVTMGSKNAIFLTLGTGLGGGLIINNKVFSGSHGIGTELGHVIVGENFYECNCGSNGCLETFVSATALIKYCKLLLQENQQSLIYKEIGDDLEKLNAKIIFDCARLKDEIALRVVDRMVKYLAIGIGNFINILDPDIIAIGGGVSESGDVFLEKLKNEVEKYIYIKGMNLTEIKLAQLKNDAGIIGAAMYAKLTSTKL